MTVDFFAGKVDMMAENTSDKSTAAPAANVSRRRFSRYRRYEKCTDDASDAKNTNVGGEIAACVA